MLPPPYPVPGIRAFLESNSKPGEGSIVDILPDERLLKVIRAIVSRTSRFSAPDVFQGLQRLTQLKVREWGVYVWVVWWAARVWTSGRARAGE